MKRLYFIILVFVTASASGQLARRNSVSYCDPSVSNLLFTDKQNNPVNANKLTIGQLVKLRFLINNNNAQNTVPKGTCKLLITLGSHFSIAKNLSTPGQMQPLDDYFKWNCQPDDEGAQYVIIGELIRDLPARYSDNVFFDLISSKEGSSVLTCQVLISNHNNGNTVLSDVVPSNNFVFSSYVNTKPFGAKFEKLDAVPHGCTLDLNWKVVDAAKEAQKYKIEVSENGTDFTTVKTVPATGDLEYKLMLDGLTGSTLYVRIKAEAATGQYVYSHIVYAEKICNPEVETALYPNPVPADTREVMLQAKTGIFNGKYQIILTDVTGKALRVMEANYTNQLQVKIDLSFLSAGTYYIRVKGEDGYTTGLKMVKQ